MMGKKELNTSVAFHLGECIKAELAEQGRTATWLAEQVHCTPENIYKTFRQQWVGMPLLFKICRAMDYDFFKVCSDYLKAEKDKQKVVEI